MRKPERFSRTSRLQLSDAAPWNQFMGKGVYNRPNINVFFVFFTPSGQFLEGIHFR